MLQEMSPGELGVWSWFYEHDPFDETRGDVQAAIIARQVSQAGLKRGDGKPWELLHFMPYAEKPAPLTDKQVLEQQFGGRVVRKKRKAKGK